MCTIRPIKVLWVCAWNICWIRVRRAGAWVLVVSGGADWGECAGWLVVDLWFAPNFARGGVLLDDWWLIRGLAIFWICLLCLKLFRLYWLCLLRFICLGLVLAIFFHSFLMRRSWLRRGSALWSIFLHGLGM